MRSLFPIVSILLMNSAAVAQTNSLLIEDMTWTEVRDAIAAGKTTAIYYAASTEQNGPAMALGKHLFVAHYLAPKIAEQLGNALVYPTMPYAPTGDWGITKPGTIDPVKKSNHMRYHGSVNVSEETFAGVAHDVALSAISTGFKNVVLVCDHGGGSRRSQELLKSWTRSGRRKGSTCTTSRTCTTKRRN